MCSSSIQYIYIYVYIHIRMHIQIHICIELYIYCVFRIIELYIYCVYRRVWNYIHIVYRIIYIYCINYIYIVYRIIHIKIYILQHLSICLCSIRLNPLIFFCSKFMTELALHVDARCDQVCYELNLYDTN